MRMPNVGIIRDRHSWKSHSANLARAVDFASESGDRLRVQRSIRHQNTDPHSKPATDIE